MTQISVSLLVLLCAGCVTPERAYRVPEDGFSFSDRELPSLMDIITHRKYKEPAGGGLYALTNVDQSFDRHFVLLEDEDTHMHIIRDKIGRTVFAERLSTPRYVMGGTMGGDVHA